MKKFTAALLALILIFAIVCMSSCSFFAGLMPDGSDDGDGSGNNGGTGDSNGGHGMAGGNNGSNGTGDDGHEHQFESYFVYSECTVDGCNVVGRNQSENTYADDFVYTLTDAKVAEIGELYDEMKACLADGDDYDYFEKLYNEYEDLFDYAIHQYQVSSILSDVEYNATTAGNYRTATKLYNEMRANYYGLYALVYNSPYRDMFYEGWDDDEIAEALDYADMYGGSKDNNNAVDDIIAEYDDYMDAIGGSIASSYTDPEERVKQLNDIGKLYGKLIDANNNVAKASRYDNYMEYAYANRYNRDYTPALVSNTMRKYVKQYVAPLFLSIAIEYYFYCDPTSLDGADKEFYYAFTSQSLFTSQSSANFSRAQLAIELIGEYFNYIKRPSTTTRGDVVDFRVALEDLFRRGNYFIGDYDGAYTWWISKIKHPILYFGPGYDSAFTFVHEFGHYYNNIYNGSMSLSYDHDETHSQGNEMLFLAWLSKNKPRNVTKGFDFVEIEQLFGMLANIVIATAVDEFEQAAYTGIYNGQPIDCSYSDLFIQILRSYSATAFLNSAYWAYVVFHSAAYYISYAMSALPSIELYVRARHEGMFEGRDSYVKLFTFSNNSKF